MADLSHCQSTWLRYQHLSDLSLEGNFCKDLRGGLLQAEGIQPFLMLVNAHCECRMFACGFKEAQEYCLRK